MVAEAPWSAQRSGILCLHMFIGVVDGMGEISGQKTKCPCDAPPCQEASSYDNIVFVDVRDDVRDDAWSGGCQLMVLLDGSFADGVCIEGLCWAVTVASAQSYKATSLAASGGFVWQGILRYASSWVLMCLAAWTCLAVAGGTCLCFCCWMAVLAMAFRFVLSMLLRASRV
mmetsp:Transcript_8121/g.15210  ORF Transcript_8121/g.15210 Transcript_8121/m.15210 type:complete len:171 (-) Transcript_8121:142-654(-)